jgi:hypothetical protein
MAKSSIFSLLLSLTAVAGEAAAQQFTAVSLHPTGEGYSRTYAVFGQMAAGRVGAQPSLWDSSGGWTSLALPGLGVGEVRGMWGDQQVGRFSSQAVGINGAILWEGTPSSAVWLHPAGASFSEARAIRGNQQVGIASFGGNRAALWTGTAASFVNLHPSWATASEAFATDGVRQGGFIMSDRTRATVWNGSAQDFVDLHPPEALGSRILGMAPGQQVGWVRSAQLGTAAAVWNDGVSGWTNFSPGGGWAEIRATTGQVQVGYRDGYAAAWFNTPESYLNLHPFLPAGFSESTAYSVWQDGNEVVIGGFAYGSGLGERAFIWRGTIPAPSALSLLAAAGVWAARRRRG